MRKPFAGLQLLQPTMVAQRNAAVLVFFAAICVGAVPARDEVRPLASAVVDAVESCVDDSTIRFGAGDRPALLDTADAEAVRAAIVQRYPKVEEDGLAPQRVLLWRHPDFGWVYIALLVNPAKAGEVCFTASFGADKFALSPVLLEKYFGTNAATR